MQRLLLVLALWVVSWSRTNAGEAQKPAAGTVLGKAAASLKPGEWVELPTIGHTRAMLKVGNHNIYQYTHEACWDPKTRQVFFLGQGHYSDLKFIRYTDDDNTWREFPTPPWWSRDEKRGFGPIGHAYDNNALDPVGGYFFHQQYGTQTVHRYDIAKDTWDKLPAVPKNLGQGGHSSALEWFPELGGLARISGHIVSVFPGGPGKENEWRLVSNKKVPLGELHYFAEYNPVHKVMIFGGGNKSNAIYKVDKDGAVTALKEPPIRSLSNTHTYIITADPVSGDYLVVSHPDKKFFAYDVVRDSWKELPDQFPEYGSLVVATPINTYGVIMYCSQKSAKVYLYKHAR